MSIVSNKLSRKNVEKLLAPTVFINRNGQVEEVPNTTSANDIQLYIELSKRQSVLGRIDDVDYKEFIEILGCSKGTFYNSLERLEKLEYIRSVSDRKGYWDITILDNIFISKEDYKQGYMRTNVDFLYSDKFKKMSFVEKKICLYLHLNKNKHRKLEIYLSNLAKSIGIKIISVVKAAIENIIEFFPCMTVDTEQGKKLVFENSKTVKNEETENANYIKHRLKTFCTRHNIKHTEKDIDDVCVLSGQYSHKLTFAKFISIMLDVVYKNTVNRWLKPEYINYMCSRNTKESLPF